MGPFPAKGEKQKERVREKKHSVRPASGPHTPSISSGAGANSFHLHLAPRPVARASGVLKGYAEVGTVVGGGVGEGGVEQREGVGWLYVCAGYRYINGDI